MKRGLMEKAKVQKNNPPIKSEHTVVDNALCSVSIAQCGEGLILMEGVMDKI